MSRGLAAAPFIPWNALLRTLNALLRTLNVLLRTLNVLLRTLNVLLRTLNVLLRTLNIQLRQPCLDLPKRHVSLLPPDFPVRLSQRIPTLLDVAHCHALLIR